MIYTCCDDLHKREDLHKRRRFTQTRRFRHPSINSTHFCVDTRRFTQTAMIYTNAKIYTNGKDLHKREDLHKLRWFTQTWMIATNINIGLIFVLTGYTYFEYVCPHVYINKNRTVSESYASISIVLRNNLIIISWRRKRAKAKHRLQMKHRFGTQ